MLSDVASLKYDLKIAQGDDSQIVLLAQVLTVADSIIKRFCKRDLETKNYTEYRDGSGKSEMWTYQKPITPTLVTGSLSLGSANVTLTIGTTTGLTVGQAICVTGGTTTASTIPGGTTIASITDSTHLVMSANALASGSFPLIVGLDVYLDAGGFYGDGVSAFATGQPPTLQLFIGKDYALKRDQPDGSSKSGLLYRLGGGLTGSILDWPGEWPKGSLTARLPPRWPAGVGNVKIAYTAGYGIGAATALGTLPPNTTIPPELTMAVNNVAAYVLMTSKLGGMPLQAETAPDYSYTLAQNALASAPELGTTRQMLRPFREVAV